MVVERTAQATFRRGVKSCKRKYCVSDDKDDYQERTRNRPFQAFDCALRLNQAGVY